MVCVSQFYLPCALARWPMHFMTLFAGEIQRTLTKKLASTSQKISVSSAADKFHVYYIMRMMEWINGDTHC